MAQLSDHAEFDVKWRAYELHPELPPLKNTFNSHRLISLAGKQGCQDALVEELFKNFNEQKKSRGDPSVLLVAAQKCGVKGAEELLRSDDEAADVRADFKKYEEGMGITGVPFFIIDDKYTIKGAPDPQTFVAIFSWMIGGVGSIPVGDFKAAMMK